MNQEIFKPGIRFSSNTIYTADRTVYDIYPDDAKEIIHPWWTFMNSSGEPLYAAFVLRHLENVTIDLHGAKLVFHGRIMPFAIQDCKNISLRNFSIDYDRPYYTQGTVVGTGDHEVTIEIPPLFRYRIEGHDLIAVSDTWEHRLVKGDMLLKCFDAETKLPSTHSGTILALIGDNIEPRPDPPLPIHHLHAHDAGQNRIRLTGLPDGFTPCIGEILAMTHEDRRKEGILLERSEDTTVENIRLIHIGAMGVVASLCHNITVRKLDMYIDEACSDRIISINADGFHTFHCSGLIQVEDCRFENMLDDAINIHGNYLYCLEKNDSHTLRALSTAQALVQMQYLLPGDSIVIYKQNTQEIRYQGTVASCSYEGDSNYLEIHVQEPLDVIYDGDMLESCKMPEVIIRRCHSRCMGGFRISTSKKVQIEDCTFATSAFAIAFTGDMNYWYENGPVKDVTIQHCVFQNCGIPVRTDCGFQPTPKMPFYHENIHFLNNTVYLSSKNVMDMQDVNGITCKGNRIYGLQEGQFPVCLNRCSNVTIE